METIGDRIKMIRRVFKLNQIEFAKRLCVTNAYISALEKGDKRPSRSLAKLICIEFGINAYWLEKGEGSILVTEILDEKPTDVFSKKPEVRCVNVRKGLPAAEHFWEAAKPLIEWMNLACDSDEKVIVGMRGAWLITNEMCINFRNNG